jgi:phage internal scaffolding protein
MFTTSKRLRVTVPLTGEVITKEYFKGECDIHTILRQFKQTGVINHITSRRAQYLDLPENIDFQASIALVEQAHQAFASLPSRVRDRFENDPALFLSALRDPALKAELTELGVFAAPKVPPVAASAAAA